MSSAADSAKAVALASLILHSADKEVTPAAVEKVLAKAGVKVGSGSLKLLLEAINTIGMKELIPDLSNMTPTAGAGAAAAPAAGGAGGAAAPAAAAPKEEEQEDTDFGMDLF